jgi:spore maturation protein CgeB
MGVQKACWVPFGADFEAHNIDSDSAELAYDLSFVGSWRPEREKVLQLIHENFPKLKIKVDGPYWSRCKYRPIRKIAGLKPLYGKAFSEVVQSSLLSLNVTDTTNYPSANMRFFEILASGGTELVSGSDEMKTAFHDNRHVLYFANDAELLEKIDFALKNRDLMRVIRSNGYQETFRNHSYLQRLKEMLSYE